MLSKGKVLSARLAVVKHIYPNTPGNKIMRSAQSNQSSLSQRDGRCAVDQKKRKRMLSNRESARKSRMRKQQHLDDLINQVAKIENENTKISTQINMLTQHYLRHESENTILRTQVKELTERLWSLNSMLRFVENSGIEVDIPEIPDALLNPWQLPYPSQPIMASADMFQC